MKKQINFLSLSLFALICSVQAQATELCGLTSGDSPNCQTASGHVSACSSAPLFHSYFRESYSEIFAKPYPNPGFEPYHYVLTPDLSHMLASTTISNAMEIARGSSLKSLNDFTYKSSIESATPAFSADQVLRKKPITLVVVPGVFGEFILVRPFEEVFQRPSAQREEFKTRLASMRASGDKTEISNTKDTSFQLDKLQSVETPFEDLIHIGSINDEHGKPLVKVVFLFAPFASLETAGDIASRATIYNRRLTKYMEIEKDENIVLVGYSRGTDVALEMVSQAQADGKNYLKNLRGLVSYSGVVFGTALADATLDSKEKAAQELSHISKLLKNLKQASPNTRENQLLAFDHNMVEFGKLADFLLTYSTGPKKHKSIKEKIGDLKDQFRADTNSTGKLVMMLARHLKLTDDSYLLNLNDNVQRFSDAIQEVLTGATQLRTKERTEWWKSHEVPNTFKYYTITSAMPHPDDNSARSAEVREFDSIVYNHPFGYNKTLDDESLVSNHIEYVRLARIFHEI